MIPQVRLELTTMPITNYGRPKEQASIEATQIKVSVLAENLLARRPGLEVDEEEGKSVFSSRLGAQCTIRNTQAPFF